MTTKIEINPRAQRWYDYEPEFYIQSAREWVEDWEYEEDAHGYCHHRSIVVGLLREIERLQEAQS